MARRRTAAPAAPKATDDTLSGILDVASKRAWSLEQETRDLREQVCAMRDERDSARDRMALLESELTDLKAKAAGYVPGREIVIGGDDTGDLARLRAERDAAIKRAEEAERERDEAREERDARPGEEEIEKLKKEVEEAERKQEEAEQEKTAAENEREGVEETSEALRADLCELARWVFSLGGSFADVSSHVSADGLALVQLAYLGGDQDVFSETVVVGTCAGSLLFRAPVTP